jgi:poly(A) polymerase
VKTESPKAVAQSIVERLHRAGHAAFWVGGCVRDHLLGREPEDFDIASDARPEQVEGLFAKTIPVGRKFGVVVVVEGGHQFQVARFRAEADYRDGRRPEHIEFADAEADARRRDFTINGLFYDPAADQIHDWVGGEKDLRAKVIRTIGAPAERFGEDHLRMLRAVRFAARLNFDLEPATWAAIQSLAPKIRVISAERVRDELIKLFAPPAPGVGNAEWAPGRGEEGTRVPAARGLVLLRDSGLLEHILPELSATATCGQSPEFHPEGSVFNHIRLMLEKMGSGRASGGAVAAGGESLPWAVLLHDIAKPVTAERDGASGTVHFYGHEKVGAELAEQILQRLRFPRKQIEEIVICVRNHMQFKDVRQMRRATLRRLLLRETFPLELELHRLDSLGSSGNLEHYEFLVREAEALKQQPSLRPPLLRGDDLLALGLPRGQKIGELLHAVREKQLAEELRTPEEARAWVKEQL